MHYDSAYTKNNANSDVDQGCPLSTFFSAAIDPILRSVFAQICRQYDTGAKLFAYLDDWYLLIKPQYLLQTFALIKAATRSVNLELQPSKVQIWRASCQDPIPAELQDKVRLTLSCLEGASPNSRRHRTQPYRSDPVLRSVMAQLCTHYDTGAKLVAYLELVPVDQTTVSTTDNRCHHSSHQISQPCSTVHQDTSMERLLPGPHTT